VDKNKLILHKRIKTVHTDNLKEIVAPCLNVGEGACYIFQCVDGSFYVGHTSEMKKRLARHNNGDGSAYTRIRRPVKLIYCEVYKDFNLAIQREYQLKGWSRKKKSELIKNNILAG
jgi:putative endonuclease